MLACSIESAIVFASESLSLTVLFASCNARLASAKTIAREKQKKPFSKSLGKTGTSKKKKSTLPGLGRADEPSRHSVARVA